MAAGNNYTNQKYPLSGLTGKIIRCAIEVHQHLGNGFQEVIYQRALAIEFANQVLEFKRVMNKKSKSSSNQTDQCSDSWRAGTRNPVEALRHE